MRRFRKKNPHIILWRSILNRVLKRFNKQKAGHTIDILGYSALDLKNHIESLFLPQMNWDNYGTELHLDHIVPIFIFDENDDPSIVNSLSNLRPLWATNRVIDGIVYEGNLNRNYKEFE